MKTENLKIEVICLFNILLTLEFPFRVGSAGIEPLSWDRRLKIAIGAARGLAFLHGSEKQIIYRDFKASNILLDGVCTLIISWPFYPSLVFVFCSSIYLPKKIGTIVTCKNIAAPLIFLIKSSAHAHNIDQTLFSFLQNFNAKISDFGLAKLGPAGGESHVSTRIMGTYGYAAPEYIATGNESLTKMKGFWKLHI